MEKPKKNKNNALFFEILDYINDYIYPFNIFFHKLYFFCYSIFFYTKNVLRANG